MAETVQLTEAATALLHRRLAGEWVEVTEETRPLYRELVQAGLMEPLSTFTRGAEGAFRLTEAACEQRTNGIASHAPLP